MENQQFPFHMYVCNTVGHMAARYSRFPLLKYGKKCTVAKISAMIATLALFSLQPTSAAVNRTVCRCFVKYRSATVGYTSSDFPFLGSSSK